MKEYYIPNIEEFYVGFECEIETSYGREKGIWPYILNEDTLTGFDIKESGILNATKNATIVVKYLDQEDVESLGFKADKDGFWKLNIDNSYYIFADFDFPTEKVLKLNSEGNVLVQFRVKDEDLALREFDGFIKNKSELKRILKQIGYELSTM